MPENPSEPMALMIELVEKTMREQPVDRDQVLVTGVSMGGYGTWDIVQRHPDWFAAAMPCCGGGDTTLAWKIRYREYPGVGHNCWTPAYADWDQVLAWFFAQRRSR